jgi:A/G-specific adenine glycosylase
MALASIEISPQQRQALRTHLLSWFRRQRRDLPWRRTRDPYAIWLSEVMLQQTQVDRVIDYYQRFLERFPTVQKLAAASLDEVMGLWSGLGYYSRARHLHRAAKEVAARPGSQLPDTVEALLELPGFGRYTAGAVASIAFGVPAPIVDGNVARVLSRLFAIEASPGTRDREHLLWSLATQLVQGEDPGDFNQSMMELGATLCTPSSPSCLLCPLQSHCQARMQGATARIPPPRKAAPRQRLVLAVALSQRANAILLARRADKGLFGGLWELPGLPISGETNPYAGLKEWFGRRATIGPEMLVLERTLTHRDLTLRVFPVALPPRLKAPPSNYVEWRWVDREAVKTLGMSSAMESVLAEALPPLKKRRSASLTAQ